MTRDYQEQIILIQNDIKDIKENHLAHIEIDVSVISTNQKWLMKFFWVIATASIGGLVVGIVNLL